MLNQSNSKKSIKNTPDNKSPKKLEINNINNDSSNLNSPEKIERKNTSSSRTAKVSTPNKLIDKINDTSNISNSNTPKKENQTQEQSKFKSAVNKARLTVKTADTTKLDSLKKIPSGVLTPSKDVSQKNVSMNLDVNLNMEKAKSNSVVARSPTLLKKGTTMFGQTTQVKVVSRFRPLNIVEKVYKLYNVYNVYINNIIRIKGQKT